MVEHLDGTVRGNAGVGGDGGKQLERPEQFETSKKLLKDWAESPGKHCQRE